MRFVLVFIPFLLLCLISPLRNIDLCFSTSQYFSCIHASIKMCFEESSRYKQQQILKLLKNKMIEGAVTYVMHEENDTLRDVRCSLGCFNLMFTPLTLWTKYLGVFLFHQLCFLRNFELADKIRYLLSLSLFLFLSLFAPCPCPRSSVFLFISLSSSLLALCLHSHRVEMFLGQSFNLKVNARQSTTT